MATFGFSAGDFVAAIGLIVKISKSLRDTDGASSEYQLICIELQTLRQILDYLQALEPCEQDAGHVNAIRCVALSCRLPLADFMLRLEKFEKGLGPFAKRHSLASSTRKTQWALTMSDEARKFRVIITAKVLSLNMLLSLKSSLSLSRIDLRMSEVLPQITDKLGNLILRQDEIQVKNSTQQSQIKDEIAVQNERLDQLRFSTDANNAEIQLVNQNSQMIARSMTSLEHAWMQLRAAIGTLPVELKTLLRRIIFTNLQMYTTLQSISSKLNAVPGTHSGDTIHFEDVLGRTERLPYVYFQHFGVLEQYLKHNFEGLPGESQVKNRQYILSRSHASHAEILPAEWHVSVFPGTKVLMSALIDYIGVKNKSICPRAACCGKMTSNAPGDGSICDHCGLVCIGEWQRSPSTIDKTRSEYSSDLPRQSPEHQAEIPVYSEEELAQNRERDENFAIDKKRLEQRRQDLTAFKRVRVAALGTGSQNWARPLIYFKVNSGLQTLGPCVVQLFDDLAPKTTRRFMDYYLGRDAPQKPIRWLYQNVARFELCGDRYLKARLNYEKDSFTPLEEMGLLDTSEESDVFLQHDGSYLLSTSVTAQKEKSSEFVISLFPDPEVDGLYIVFGKVVYGRRVIDQIYLDQWKKLKVTTHITEIGVFNDEITFNFPPTPARHITRQHKIVADSSIHGENSALAALFSSLQDRAFVPEFSLNTLNELFVQGENAIVLDRSEDIKGAMDCYRNSTVLLTELILICKDTRTLRKLFICKEACSRRIEHLSLVFEYGRRIVAIQSATG